jgi:hypothetical protein
VLVVTIQPVESKRQSWRSTDQENKERSIFTTTVKTCTVEELELPLVLDRRPMWHYVERNGRVSTFHGSTQFTVTIYTLDDEDIMKIQLVAGLTGYDTP